MEASGQLYKEPYRATKLWLSCVALFRSGIPLSKHRRQWKTYENSFVASEAITWFNSQLQENFQLSITKKQTHQLLQKFYKAGIFIEASNRTGAGGGVSPARDEVDFKDNVKLYRLTDNNPTAAEATAAKENESQPGKSNYTVVIKPLTVEEIHYVWEQTFIERFILVVGYDVYASFLKPGIIEGRWIFHNMTKIGQYGIVLNSNGEEELPTWLVQAMKCLASWPNNHTLDASVPSYPGIENDVFKLVKEYFTMYKDVAPLLTHDLYDAFITTFIRAELFDFNTRVYGIDNSFLRKPSYNGRRAKREESYPFNASESVENLIMEILTPSSARNKNKILIQPKRIFGEVNEIEESFSVPKPMPAQAYTLSRYAPQRYINETPFFYETAFTTGKSPITRVLSKTELESSMGSLPRVLREKSGVNANCPSPNNVNSQFAYENPTLTLSPSDMINHPKYNRILKNTVLGKPQLHDLPSYSFMDVNTPKRKASPTTHSCRDFNIECDFGPTRKPERSRSAADLSDCVRDRSPYVPGNPRNRPLARGLNSHYANSPSRSVRKTLDFYYGAEACVPGLMTTEGKELAIASFRLLTLLLPAKNRRHLQLLIRCMAKMSRNEKLMLDVSMTTRALVINAFFRCILCCADRTEFDELLALRIVTFLMDNDSQIFDVSMEEKNISQRAEETISKLQIVKIPAETETVTVSTNVQGDQEENAEPKFACNRITMNEYEDQRLLASTSKSLRDLLDAFEQSTDEKERKKRLREFREEYPHIFYEKFGDSEPLPLDTSGTKPAEKKKPFSFFKFRF